MAVTQVYASGSVGGVKVNGTKVIGEQGVNITAANANVTGLAVNTNDATMVATKAELDATSAKLNLVIAALKTHGLLASS